MGRARSSTDPGETDRYHTVLSRLRGWSSFNSSFPIEQENFSMMHRTMCFNSCRPNLALLRLVAAALCALGELTGSCAPTLGAGATTDALTTPRAVTDVRSSQAQYPTRPNAFPVERLADGDFAHFGQVALTTPENAGDIANLGVIVGRDAVAVVDTGGSVQVGQQLLVVIRTITNKPIRYVINTHEHPDHIFGNAAFGSGVTFVGHHNLPAEMQKRGAFYLGSFRDALGQAAIERVQIIPPTLLVAEDMTLALGDRTLRLTAWNPAAHTDCDLTVLDQTTGVLFAGDLVFLQHVPVVDGSLKGWLSILPRLAELPAKIVVPGHGPPAPWPQALDNERRYLTVLVGDTRRLIAAGVPMAAAVSQIGQSERGHWALFDDYNPRNATTAFSELEWE
jgi:quinoprotein relay system zinc metallohydrolase 2